MALHDGFVELSGVSKAYPAPQGTVVIVEDFTLSMR